MLEKASKVQKSKKLTSLPEPTPALTLTHTHTPHLVQPTLLPGKEAQYPGDRKAGTGGGTPPCSPTHEQRSGETGHPTTSATMQTWPSLETTPKVSLPVLWCPPGRLPLSKLTPSQLQLALDTTQSPRRLQAAVILRSGGPPPECKWRQYGQPPRSEGTGQGVLAAVDWEIPVSPAGWTPPTRRQETPHLTSPEGPLTQRPKEGAAHQVLGTHRAHQM